jgi:uncharacterized Ntn-hydrolase superfamily protein
MMRKCLWVLLAIVPVVVAAQRPATAPRIPDPNDTPGTFSILAFDPETGEVGGAVQSRVFSVGNGVLWAEAGAGVVATQAIVDVSYGPQGIALLKQGVAPAEVIKRILAADTDPGLNGRPWPKAGRQFAVMNAKGELAAYTGPDASTWAGDKQGKFCTAQGNILAGPAVVEKMVEAFEASEKTPDGQRNHLSLRLVAALEAGQAAGGDTRGQMSAALLVVKKNGGVWLNNDVVLRLQVDHHDAPIAELRRLVELSPPARAGRGRGGRAGSLANRPGPVDPR